jgi:hypothetical protein
MARASVFVDLRGIWILLRVKPPTPWSKVHTIDGLTPNGDAENREPATRAVIVALSRIYSASSLACCTTLVQRAISAFTCAAKPSGVVVAMEIPSDSRRWRSGPLARRRLRSVLILVMIAGAT